MQRDSTLVFRYVRQDAIDSKSVIAAWQRIKSLYKRVDGPKIFATYYNGAAERVSASEPVTSLKTLKG